MTTTPSFTGSNPIEKILSRAKDFSDVAEDGVLAAKSGKGPLEAVSDEISKKTADLANSTLRKAALVTALGPVLGVGVEAVVGPALEKADDDIPRELPKSSPEELLSKETSFLVQFTEELDQEGCGTFVDSSEHSGGRLIIAEMTAQFFRDILHVAARPAEAAVEGSPTVKGAEAIIDAIHIVPPDIQKKLGLDLLETDLRANVSGDPQTLVSSVLQGAASTTGNVACLIPQVDNLKDRVSAAMNGDSRPLADWCRQKLKDYDELASGDERLFHETLVNAFKSYSEKCEANRKKYANPPPGQKVGETVVNSTSEQQSARQDMVHLMHVSVPELMVPVATGGKTNTCGGAPSPQKPPTDQEGGRESSSQPMAPQDVSEKRKEFCEATRTFVEESVRKGASTNPVLLEKPPEIPSAKTWDLSVSAAYLSEARLHAQRVNRYQLKGMSQEEFDENLKWGRRRLENLEKDVQSVPVDIVLGSQKIRVEKAAAELRDAREKHAQTGRNALNVDKAKVRFIVEVEFYDRLVKKLPSSPVEDRPVTGAIIEEWLSARQSQKDAQNRAGKHADPHCITSKAEKVGKEFLHGIGMGRDPDVIAEDEQFIATVYGDLAERDERIIDHDMPLRSFSANPEEGLGWTPKQLKEEIALRRAKSQEQQRAFKGVGLDSQIAQQRKVVEAMAKAYEDADAEARVSHKITKRNELFCQYVAECDLLADIELKKSELSSAAVSTTPVSGTRDARQPPQKKESPPPAIPKKDPPGDHGKGGPAPQHNGATDPKDSPQPPPSDPKKDPPGDHGKGGPAPQHNGAADPKDSPQPPPSDPKKDPPDDHEKDDPSKGPATRLDLKKMPEIKPAAATSVIQALRASDAAIFSSSTSASTTMPQPSRFSVSYGGPSGRMMMETPIRPREARLMNAQSKISEIFGNGPQLPGRFESHEGGKVAFKFDNPHDSRFNPQTVRGDFSSHYSLRTLRRTDSTFRASQAPQPRSSSFVETLKDDLRGPPDDPMIGSIFKLHEYLTKKLAHGVFLVTKKTCRGIHDLFSKQEFLHEEKVGAHVASLNVIECSLPELEYPVPGSPLSVCRSHSIGRPMRKALHTIFGLMEQRNEASKKIHEICAAERELHTRNEQDTKKYRVHFSDAVEPEDQKFTPQFVEDLKPLFATVERCEMSLLSVLKTEEEESDKKFIYTEIQALAGTLSAQLQAHIKYHSLYAKGVQQLTSGTYSLKPDSEAFRALSRLYIHEFVDAIQNGVLKEEFLRSENGRQFRENLWKAYTDLEEKERLVVAAQQEHAQMGFGWRALDYVRGTPKVAQGMKDLKSSEAVVVGQMRQIHLNILAQSRNDT